ncbi:hypothetical protein [Halorientalis sp. IM1011]|uniref:hypothetical protein n=1 Tax=Halorientalis sp. IM1011 TaxID=1932360 RepID=UPI000A0699A4|nr:hypothetical protein [Halorientalis sp. IM1011]
MFLADDPDPAQGTVPQFVVPDLSTLTEANETVEQDASRVRDFYYPTTTPSYRAGPQQQTLREYRTASVTEIRRNRTSSLWLPTSERSNGTVIADAHITILGTAAGTKSRLSVPEVPNTPSNDTVRYIPRNGTVFAHLDFATTLPPRHCSTTNGTRICHTYSLADQHTERQLSIGNQSWATADGSPRQLEYSGATASAPTTLSVTATITSTVTTQTTTSERENGEWVVDSRATSQTDLTHTVTDQTPVIVTTNQPLSVTQTVVRSDGEVDRLVLEFDGPAALNNRRLWSQATFEESNLRLRNVWGIYSQRQFETATRGTQYRPTASASQSTDGEGPQPGSEPLQSPTQATAGQKATGSSPNVLELQLAAARQTPTLQRPENRSMVDPPTITGVEQQSLSSQAAPIAPQVNLSSVAPSLASTVVIENVDQPIDTLRDIHGDRIPLTTTDAQERPTNINTTRLNDTHARVRLQDGVSGQPLRNRTLTLQGAAKSTVTTSTDGTAIVERRDLFVTASFAGATDVSRGVYYDTAETQIEFTSKAFNIYALLSSIAGALVSIAAFLVFFIPVAYLRRGRS